MNPNSAVEPLIEVMRIDSGALETAKSMIVELHTGCGIVVSDIEFEAFFDVRNGATAGERVVALYPKHIAYFAEPESQRADCARHGKRLPMYNVAPNVLKGFLPTKIVAPSQVWAGLLETSYEPEMREEGATYQQMCPYCVSDLLVKSVGKWVAYKQRVSRAGAV